MLGELVAFAAILISGFGALVEIYSIKAIDRRLQREHDFMVERGTVGEQFGDWLLHSDAEGEPQNIAVLTDLVANRVAEAQKFRTLQELSVDSRIQNKYDEKVEAALKARMPVGYKILMKAAEYLGFDLNEIITEDELGPFIESLRKYNVPLMFGGEMPGGNPGKWKKGELGQV